MEPQHGHGDRQCAAQHGVGDVLQALGELSDEELECHIEDCQHLWMTAYERFQLYGDPNDRDEALLHLHRMNEAILARSPAVQAARHAAFEQRLDDGIDYFQSTHALELGRTC
jgi:hypothetical protein